jgi:hypothetical protein
LKEDEVKEEGCDVGWIKMRMLAIYDAQDTMGQGVIQRDNPPDVFLA